MRVLENNEKNVVDFSDLDIGDAFRHEGRIFVKTDWEQDAVRIDDGVVYEQMCREKVIPVNAEVQVID